MRPLAATLASLPLETFRISVHSGDTNLHRELRIATQLTYPGGREVSGFRACKGVSRNTLRVGQVSGLPERDRPMLSAPDGRGTLAVPHRGAAWACACLEYQPET